MKKNPGFILAAEAPHYFPALSYFYKMAHAEIFVFADDLQFSKHAGMNRCQIKTANGPERLTVPVRTKGRLGQKINAVEILDENSWRRKHWQSLAANYRRAAYFEKYAEALENFFLQPRDNLADLNFAVLKWLCEILQIDCRLVRGLEMKTKACGSERIIAWAKALGGKIYFCEAREMQRLEREKFEAADIAIQAYEFVPPVCHQQFGAFAPNLSILDLILNEGEESRRILAGASGLLRRKEASQ